MIVGSTFFFYMHIAHCTFTGITIKHAVSLGNEWGMVTDNKDHGEDSS